MMMMMTHATIATPVYKFYIIFDQSPSLNLLKQTDLLSVSGKCFVQGVWSVLFEGSIKAQEN